MVEAKPHWGDRARSSIATWRDAASMRRRRSAADSRAGNLLDTRPSTTVFPRGTNRSGSNVPERSSSYSRRNRSTWSAVKSFSAMGS